MHIFRLKNSTYFQKDLHNIYNSNINLNILINLIFFILFFTIFFIYQLNVFSLNFGFDIFINSLVLIIFVISVFNLRIGFYVYVFLLPLLNSVFIFFNQKPIPVIYNSLEKQDHF